MTRLFWIAVLGLVLPTLVLAQEVESGDDLCKDVKCKKPRGAWCQVIEEDGAPKATCVCPKTCPEDQDFGGPVCSVFGKQYDNICEFHKYACKKRKTIPLAFHKPCIAPQKPCSKEEFIQFPYRLLEWFMHLKEKDEFGRIDPNRRITLLDNDRREQVATWKFDALDRNQDDQLDKAELLKFRYALMPLEHCAAPFFTRCAKLEGDAKRISVAEWAQCLKVYMDPATETDVDTTDNQEEPVVEEEEEEEDVEEEEEDAPEAA